jgi:hypothetical protein
LQDFFNNSTIISIRNKIKEFLSGFGFSKSHFGFDRGGAFIAADGGYSKVSNLFIIEIIRDDIFFF